MRAPGREGGIVRVAVVGNGYWGRHLLRNFHRLSDCALVACCDLEETRLAQALRLYPQIRPTPLFADLLAASDLDALALATPPATHFNLTREALLADKHVLVEKPMTLSSAHAKELVELARRRGRILMVGHTFEYNPAVLKMKELLVSGQIGDPFYLHAHRVNLGRVRSDTNALWSIAPHDVSIALFLLGQMPVSVQAQGATYLGHSVEDVVFVTLRFPGGVLCHIHASWLDPSKQRLVTLVGSRKMIVYDDVASEGKIRLYDKGVYRLSEGAFGEYQYKIHSGDISVPMIDLAEPLALECAHFVSCVRTGEVPRTDGENGSRVVRVLEAAQASLAKQGERVSLAD